MLISVDHSIGLVVIPKAASNSIMDAIRISGKHWAELLAREFEELPQRYAFIRDPHERAASVYNMYRRTGCGRRHDISSFSNFIASICDDDDNDPHVMPQMRLCAPKGHFLPSHIIRWDFAELAKIIGVDVMPHNNRGDHRVEWDAASYARFGDVFAGDIAMWRGSDDNQMVARHL